MYGKISDPVKQDIGCQLTNWVYVTFDNGQSLSDPVEMFL